MFTGIIMSNGTIESLERLDSGARLRLRATFDEPFERGESVAVNGVCLTVLPQRGGALLTDVSNETLSRSTLGSALIPETLRRTNLGTANLGDRVNLEFDMIAKYIRSLAMPYLAARACPER